ncbi:hypothetical protein ACMXYX_04930 [Neptuniibacter sp. QD72_48]|uniref:hypothetical protein n=1 Tax=Neptuniibacter sp. QD72_48 TaxID=3398214 RepID=UPI0039F47C85
MTFFRSMRNYLYKTNNYEMKSEEKGVRNFFVRSESIHSGAIGISRRANYLYNIEHPNHKHTKAIIPIHGNATKVSQRAICEIALMEAQKSKGGRPRTSFAQEICFSPPKGQSATPEQWKEALKAMLLVIADRTNLSPNTVARNSYSVVHQQENEHLHLSINKVIERSDYRKELTRPSTTNALKREWNRQCQIMFGLTPDTYKPKRKSTKSKAQRWEELKIREEALEKEEEQLKAARQNLKLFLAQCQKWIEAKLLGNTKQAKRQENRMHKTYTAMQESSFTEGLEVADAAIKGAEQKTHFKLKPY